MYWPRPGIKKHPEKRWKQPDRIFFGFGSCNILAGVFLETTPFTGFYGEWIVPVDAFSGTHMFVTNGEIAFDFHGYSFRNRLIAHHWRGHQAKFEGWNAQILKINFPLLHTVSLNSRKHMGPDQYYGDPVERAKLFISSKKPHKQLQTS